MVVSLQPLKTLILLILAAKKHGAFYKDVIVNRCNVAKSRLELCKYICTGYTNIISYLSAFKMQIELYGELFAPESKVPTYELAL